MEFNPTKREALLGPAALARSVLTAGGIVCPDGKTTVCMNTVAELIRARQAEALQRIESMRAEQAGMLIPTFVTEAVLAKEATGNQFNDEQELLSVKFDKFKQDCATSTGEYSGLPFIKSPEVQFIIKEDTGDRGGEDAVAALLSARKEYAMVIFALLRRLNNDLWLKEQSRVEETLSLINIAKYKFERGVSDGSEERESFDRRLFWQKGPLHTTLVSAAESDDVCDYAKSIVRLVQDSNSDEILRRFQTEVLATYLPEFSDRTLGLYVKAVSDERKLLQAMQEKGK